MPKIKLKKLAYLHSHGKIVLRFRWEENVNGLLLERLITGWWLTDFDYMQLKS